MSPEVKRVNFNGDQLLAVRNRGSGKIFVGVNMVCSALGLNPRRQRARLADHPTLSQGCTKQYLPSEGGQQECFCIELEFLPLWLVTINPAITKGKKEKLVEYQLKAKDVLANAFLADTQQAPNTSSIIPQTYSAALRLAANLQEKIEALEPKAEQYDQFMEARGFQTMNHVAKSLGTGRNRMMRFLRVRGVFMMDNTPYQRYINQGLFAVKQRVIMGRPCVQPFASPKGIAFIAKVMR